MYDTIIIGSSPVLLLEAVHLSRQGRRVVVLESRSRLGGAWYGRDLWGMGHVDVGCHYIERREYTFRLLTEVLGIPCDRQRYDLLWHTGPPSEEERAAPSAVASVRHCLVKWLLAGRLVHTDLWRMMRKIAMFRLRELPSAFADLFLRGSRLYPRGGAHAVVSAILAQIQESSVRVITEAAVDRVAVGEEGAPVVVHTEQGVVLGRGVVTGQHVAFDVLRAGKSIRPERQLTSWDHTVLRVKGNKQRPFDFIEIFKSPVTSLRRIQDVTPYATKRSNSTGAQLREVSRLRRAWRDYVSGLRGGAARDLQKDDLLICCQGAAECSSRSEHPKDLLEHLKQLRLLTGDTQLIAWHSESYKSFCDDILAEVSEIEPDLPEEIRMMQTWDLGLCLELNRGRWGSLR